MAQKNKPNTAKSLVLPNFRRFTAKINRVSFVRFTLLGLVLLILLAVAPFSTPINLNKTALAASLAAPKSSEISFRARSLYDGFYREGGWVATEVTINNSSTQALQGELRSTFALNVNAIDYSFVRPVVVDPKSEIKFFVYLLPSQRINNPVLMQLYSSDGEQLAETSIRLQLANTADFVIGFLTDNASQPATRLGVLTLRGNSVRTIPLNLTPDDLPERQEGLDIFNTIVVTDISPGKIGDAARQALLAWVSDGGQLILAASPNLGTLASMIDPNPNSAILPAQVGGIQNIERFAIQTVPGETRPAINFPANSTLPLTILNPNPDGRVLARQANNSPAAGAPLLVAKPLGRGNIVMCAINPFNSLLSGWSSMREWWILLIEAGISNLVDYTWLNQNIFNQESLNRALLTLPGPDMPDPLLFIIGLIVYVTLAVPVTYLVLRHFKRPALAWGIIPGFAVLMGGALMWISSQLPIGDIYLNRVTLVEAAAENMPLNVKSFILLTAANDEPYKVQLTGPNVLLRPQYLPPNNQSPAQALPPQLLQQTDAPLATALQSMDDGRNRLQIFGAEGLQDSNKASFEGRFEIAEDDKIVGTAINRSSFALHDITLVYGDNYLPLGDWQPGEEKKIVFPLKLRPVLTPRSSVDPALFRRPAEISATTNGTPTPFNSPNPLPTPGTSFAPADGGDNVSPLALTKLMILNTAFLNGRFTPLFRSNSLYLTGWLDAPVIGGAQVEGRKLVQQHLALLIKPLPLSYVAENGKATIPAHAMWLERLVDGSRPVFGALQLSSNAPVVIQYRLPTEVSNPTFQATRLTLLLNVYREQDRAQVAPRNLTLGRWGNPLEPGNLQANPKVEVFNWETNRWDEVAAVGDSRNKIEITGPTSRQYVEPYNGLIRVRLLSGSESLILQQINLSADGFVQK